ncbi:ankyrin-1-like isoform X2 [Mytilus edulis]
MSQILAGWKMTNVYFVETRAAKNVLECVQENSCVTITASNGVGKTAIIQHVALKMADRGYNIMLVTAPNDIVKFYNPNQKTLFVMDDFCGIYSINQFDLNSLELVMERIEELIEDKFTKLIVACRLQVYQDEKFESLSIFRTCVCNLLSKDLCLSQTEKQSIADLYLETRSPEIIQYSDLYDCFPLLCKLYNDNPDHNITDFFQNPYSVFEAEIDNLHKHGHFGKYCVLALCVMFNNRLEEKWLTDEVNTELRTIIENTCQTCNLDRYTSPLILLDEIKSLQYTFIKQEQDVYKTIHTKLFDFLAYYFGQHTIQCVIKNADSAVIGQRFLLQSNSYMDQFVTVIPSYYHVMYMERMIDDWYNGKLQHVFDNINMKIPAFRQKFLCHLNTVNISSQRQLALICDVNYKTTVLFRCCLYDDIPLILWCLHHGVDVNQCNCDGMSPLFGSVLEGHSRVVQLLLDNNADIDKCITNGASPLFVACQNNHIETVKILLDNNADIEQRRDDGASSLFVACENNHIETVKILLDNNADIDQRRDDGASSLFVACQNNYIETVKILLDNNADIEQRRDDGASSLFVACQNNYIETVKILLDNNADIDQRRDDGASPLFVACQNNHIETVKILLDNNADIDQRRDDGASSLFVACQNNHIETVKVLLDNNADIKTCRDDQVSPLYVACKNNQIAIVNLLLDYIDKCATNESPLFVACHNNYIETGKVLLDIKADSNKCTDIGESPLHIACKNNHIETVKILLDNNTDIDKCTDSGVSPLFIACQNNHIETVKILLDYNADINKCTDSGVTPLFVTCENNHKETVKILLDNNADSNKCTDTGASPLYIACHKNHTNIVKLLLNYAVIHVTDCTDTGASPLSLSRLTESKCET